MSIDFKTAPLTERHEVSCPRCGACVWAVETHGVVFEAMTTSWISTDLSEALRDALPPGDERGGWRIWVEERACVRCAGRVQWLFFRLQTPIECGESDLADRARCLVPIGVEEWSVCVPRPGGSVAPARWFARQTADDTRLTHLHCFTPAAQPWLDPQDAGPSARTREVMAAVGDASRLLLSHASLLPVLAAMAERDSAGLLNRAAEALTAQIAAVPSLDAWRDAILAMEVGLPPACGAASLERLLDHATVPENVRQSIGHAAAATRSKSVVQWRTRLGMLARRNVGDVRKYEEWAKCVSSPRFPLHPFALGLRFGSQDREALPASAWVDWDRDAGRSDEDLMCAERVLVSGEAWEHFRGAARQLAKTSDARAVQNALRRAADQGAWPIAEALAEALGARVPFAAIASTPCEAVERVLRRCGSWGDDARAVIAALFADPENASAIREQRSLVESSFPRWAGALGSSPEGMGAIGAILESLSEPDVALRLLRASMAEVAFSNPERIATLHAQLEQRSLGGVIADSPAIGVGSESPRPLAAPEGKRRRL